MTFFCVCSKNTTVLIHVSCKNFEQNSYHLHPKGFVSLCCCLRKRIPSTWRLMINFPFYRIVSRSNQSPFLIKKNLKPELISIRTLEVSEREARWWLENWNTTPLMVDLVQVEWHRYKVVMQKQEYKEREVATQVSWNGKDNTNDRTRNEEDMKPVPEKEMAVLLGWRVKATSTGQDFRSLFFLVQTLFL